MFKYVMLYLSSFLMLNGDCIVNKKEAPLWICKTSSYDSRYVTAMGIATKNNLPFTIIKKLAVANARANLAETIKIKVQSELYMKTSSIVYKDKESVENKMINMMHTMAKEKISNYVILETWENEKDLYILIGI